MGSFQKEGTVQYAILVECTPTVPDFFLLSRLLILLNRLNDQLIVIIQLL